jgi:UTP--glucose-1-phosphate uridylyltransferase
MASPLSPKSEQLPILADFEKLTSTSQGTLVAEKMKELVKQVEDEKERTAFAKEMDGFMQLFLRYLETRKKVINWEQIKPPPKELVIPYSELPECPADQIQNLAKKLCVLKLNGGLGTTMGCVGPKSIIEVTRELSFLDLTVQQIEVSRFFLFVFSNFFLASIVQFSFFLFFFFCWDAFSPS